MDIQPIGFNRRKVWGKDAFYRRTYSVILSAEILSIRTRSDPIVKDINLFGNELKLSQFADDTNLFCADLISVEKAFNVSER